MPDTCIAEELRRRSDAARRLPAYNSADDRDPLRRESRHRGQLSLAEIAAWEATDQHLAGLGFAGTVTWVRTSLAGHIHRPPATTNSHRR